MRLESTDTGHHQASESVILLLRQLSDAENEPAGRNLAVLVLISSVLICLILATIVGNVFVIAAVVLERSLRTVGNYLVVSLAITDLLVACLVMPIAAVYEVAGGWTMGVKLCEVWTFVDVLCCTTSIFHLLAIACDRLWAVTTVDYIHRRKAKHVCIGIALIWSFSAMISLGPMLGWKDDQFEERILARRECLVSQQLSYQIFATIASFYAPSVLLLLQYYRIYQVAKARLKLKKQRYQGRVRHRPSFYRSRKESELKEFPRVMHRIQDEPYSSSVPGQPAPSSSGVYSSSTTTNTTLTTSTALSVDSAPALVRLALASQDTTGRRFSVVQFLNRHHSDTELRSNESSFDESTIMFTEPATAAAPSNIVVYVDDYGSTSYASCSNEFELSPTGQQQQQQQPQPECCPVPVESPPAPSNSPHKRRRRIRKLQFRSKKVPPEGQHNSAQAKHESKAAKTLTIITGVFIICWLPFFVLALVMPLCNGHCPAAVVHAFDISLWLGWANSTLNPFLYTIFSPDFRNAFKKLLNRIRKREPRSAVIRATLS